MNTSAGKIKGYACLKSLTCGIRFGHSNRLISFIVSLPQASIPSLSAPGKEKIGLAADDAVVLFCPRGNEWIEIAILLMMFCV